MQARNAALDAGMDPAVPQEAWRVQQEQVADAMYDVAKEVRSAYLEALPILTEPQKAEGKALLKKAHGHMEGMHGRHHGFALGFLKNRLELTDAPGDGHPDRPGQSQDGARRQAGDPPQGHDRGPGGGLWIRPLPRLSWTSATGPPRRLDSP